MTMATARSPAPEVHEFRDPDAGLHAFVAIDDTTPGPAFGGCRFIRYEHAADAIADAERLAAGMTLKNALARIPFGGGKAVIMAPPGAFDRERLFRAFGSAVDGLGGRYVTAMDSGTETSDMDAIGACTRFVSGRTGAEGDPSPCTALGVFLSIRAALSGRGESLAGRRVAIQGVGHVGSLLAEHLAAAGAEVLVADPVHARAEALATRIGARIVPTDALLTTACDILAPCGLGGVLHDDIVPELRCRMIAGAANNQLQTPGVARALDRRGILYLPDFLINAGGVVHAALAWTGAREEVVTARVEQIGATVADVLARAADRRLLPIQVALELARTRIEGAATAA